MFCSKGSVTAQGGGVADAVGCRFLAVRVVLCGYGNEKTASRGARAVLSMNGRR